MGDKKAERGREKGKREREGREKREEGRGENNLVTFLQLRPCLLVRMRSPPDITNNCDKFIRQYKQCSYSDLHSEAVTGYTRAKCFSQQVCHQRLESSERREL